QVGWDASRGFDLGRVSDNSGCKLGDVRENAFAGIEYLCGRCEDCTVSGLVELFTLPNPLRCTHLIHCPALLVSHVLIVLRDRADMVRRRTRSMNIFAVPRAAEVTAP